MNFMFEWQEQYLTSERSEHFRGRPEDVSMIHQRIQVQFKRQT